MMKPEQLDKLERMVDVIGIRSVILVAYTEGYAQALRESFQKITQVTEPIEHTVIEKLMNRGTRTAENELFIANLEKRSMSTWSDEELEKYHFLTGQANNRHLADMEHAGISEAHPSAQLID